MEVRSLTGVGAEKADHPLTLIPAGIREAPALLSR